MRYKKETLKIDVIEVGGQSLSAIPSQAFQGVSGIIFAFDINDRQSYKNIPSVIHTASQYVDLKDIVCILAGNKCDLDYAVPEETIDEFSMDINMVSLGEMEARKLQNSQNFCFLVQKSIFFLIF